MVMELVFDIPVDLKEVRSVNTPLVTQNDSVVFILTVTENGIPFDLTDATTVSLTHNRQGDGTVVVTMGTRFENKATFVLNAGETSVAGGVIAKAQFYDADGRVSSLSFGYQVGKDPTGVGYTPSENEQTLIEVVLNDGPLRIQEAIEATGIALGAADYANEQGDKALQVAIDNKIIPLATVDTVALRNSTYPSPLNGSLVTVTQGANGNAETYRFVTGTGWVLVDKYNGTTITNINQQLAETSQKADTLEANQPNLLNKNLGGTVTAPVTFNQNVTFVGTTTGYNPTTSTIDNQFYKVNSNVVGAPVLDGGIEVERGTDTNVFLSWNETNKSWEYSDEFGFKQAVSPEFSGADLIKDKELKTILPYLKERAIDYGFKHDVAAYKNAKYGSFLFPLESELITNIAEGDTIQVYAYIKTNFANQARLAARFKNSGGTYIGTMSLSKLVRKTNDWMQVGLEIVVPVGASVLDIGISNSLNDASVFSLLAIPSVFKGRVPAPKLVENVMETSLTQQFQKTVKSFEKDTPSYFDYVSNLIRDPFTKTKIKTIGDSITAGVGGTGYSTTGPLIFTDVYGVTRYRNVTTATCWANSLKTYLETRIAKVYSVGFDDPHFELKGAYTMGHDTDTSIGTTLTLANLANREGINFDFYGDGFTMLYNKRPESGKLTIYVDDVLVATVDAYNSAVVKKHPVTISGLTLGNHKVKIKETGSKNAASTGYSVVLECIQIQKHIQVENWGISGITSKYLWEHKDQYIQADDNIYIIQIGTNDRSVYPSASGTVSNITKFTQYCLDKGITPLLMSANPVQAINDNNVIFNFRLFDVDIAVKESANRFMMPHISNYQLYWDYEDKTGLSMDTLLNDQLHPNDAGYKIYFENVLKHLKLPRIRTGVN